MIDFSSLRDFIPYPYDFLLLAWGASVLVSFSMLTGYRNAVTSGWVLQSSLPRDEAALGALGAHPHALPSFCEACGRRLSLLSRTPLVGWLFGCRGCGSHGGFFYPLAEWLAAWIMALSVLTFGFPDALVILFGCMLWAAAAASDRVSLSVSMPLSMLLFWLGLLASPFAELGARVTGAFFLFAVPVVVPLWRALRSKPRPVPSPRVERDDDPPSTDPPVPLPSDPLAGDAVPPALPLGEGDWLALASLGAWLGCYPAVAALVIASLLFVVSHPAGRPGAFLPSLSAGAALSVILLQYGWLGGWSVSPVLPWF